MPAGGYAKRDEFRCAYRATSASAPALGRVFS
jgi:hypothetical protein